MKKIKCFKNNNAVSNVIGTILLLGFLVIVFSGLYIMVLTDTSAYFDTEEPYPDIVAFVEEDNVVIEHQGGDEIDIDNIFKFNDLTIDLQSALDDTNNDNKWNLGERLYIPLTDINGDPNHPYSTDIDEVDIFGTDVEGDSGRGIFSGSLDVYPKSDIAVRCSINNKTPLVGENVEITITVTHFTGNMPIPPGIKLNFQLPDSLQYISEINNSGIYTINTGDWILDELNVRQSAHLIITAKVIAIGTISNFTQLAMVLDGSGSIGSTDFGIMKEGLAKAIEDYLPHNGMVELTVVHFANNYANVEVNPIIITEGNYLTEANKVRTISYRGGATPLSCGLYLTSDTLKNSLNFNINHRQVINVVTDGVPNVKSWSFNPYLGFYTSEINGKNDAELAQSYLLNQLYMTNDGSQTDGDELDVEAIDFPQEGYSWLSNKIVWPQPANEDWPPTAPGWIRSINTYQEFADTIGEQFELLFGGIPLNVEIQNLGPININVEINETSLIFTPHGPN